MSAEPNWLTAEQDQTWRAFRLMTRQLEARLAAELGRDAALSIQDYDVLSTVSDAPDVRWCAKDLAEHLLWSQSRLSHHLDRMQRRGLVRREPCTEARGVDVVMTDLGRTRIEAAAPGHVQAVRHSFIDRLTSEDLDTLERVSRQVLDGLLDHPTQA